MTGRQETNNKLEAKVKELIKGQPQIVVDYTYSFTNKTAGTKLDYVRDVTKFLEYLKSNNIINVNDTNEYKKIKPSDMAKYMEDGIRYRYVNGVKKENAEITRATKFYAIRNFFEFLAIEGYIEHNPCARIKPPKCTKENEVVAMTSDEIEIMKSNIIKGVGSSRSRAKRRKFINRDLLIVTLGCATGLRATSITEINISDIDFEENCITVREKGNKERRVYFGEKTKSLMYDWLKDRRRLYPNIETDALFISEKKNRISTLVIRDVIKTFSVGIDKHLTPHKMRSSCATNLYEKTGDIYLVQEILGHKNIANTRRYAKVSEAKRQSAVNILDNL